MGITFSIDVGIDRTPCYSSKLVMYTKVSWRMFRLEGYLGQGQIKVNRTKIVIFPIYALPFTYIGKSQRRFVSLKADDLRQGHGDACSHACMHACMYTHTYMNVCL